MGIDILPVHLESKILGIVVYRDHRQAVKMEAELITEAYRGNRHIEREPRIDKPYVELVSLIGDKYKAQHIDKCGGDTEPYEKIRLAHKEETRKSEDQEQDHAVYYQCELPYL